MGSMEPPCEVLPYISGGFRGSVGSMNPPPLHLALAGGVDFTHTRLTILMQLQHQNLNLKCV